MMINNNNKLKCKITTKDPSYILDYDMKHVELYTQKIVILECLLWSKVKVQVANVQVCRLLVHAYKFMQFEFLEPV